MRNCKFQIADCKLVVTAGLGVLWAGLLMGALSTDKPRPVVTDENSRAFIGDTTETARLRIFSSNAPSGSGMPVLSSNAFVTNWTLVTPTVASLANMTHTHQNAAGGGTLDAAAIAAGTLAKARGGAGADMSSVTFPGTGVLVTAAGTATLTEKTLDVSASGNVLKMKGYVVLTGPDICDGTGTVIYTNDFTQVYYGQGLFSGTAATNANWIEYRLTVPEDLDTGVELRVARWKVRLNGGDTGSSVYNIGMANVADSASYGGTVGSWIALPVGADASGAAGDVETASNVTLTGWAAGLTPGALWVVRVNRDGAGDASNVAHYSGPLVIEYGVTQ